jgi:hypothetical protein
MPDTWSGSPGWRITLPAQRPVPGISLTPVVASQRRLILRPVAGGSLPGDAHLRRGRGGSQARTAGPRLYRAS